MVCSGISWKSEFLSFQSEVLFAFSGVLPPVRFATQNVGASTRYPKLTIQDEQINTNPIFPFFFPAFLTLQLELEGDVTPKFFSFSHPTVVYYSNTGYLCCVFKLSFK